MGLERLLDEVEKSDVKQAMLFDLGGNRDKKTPDLKVMKTIAGRFGKSYVAGHILQEDIEHLENIGLSGAIIDFRSMEDSDVGGD